MLVGICRGAFIHASGIGDMAVPALATAFQALPAEAVCLGGPYPVQLEPVAKVLPICRLGDEPRSPSGEKSQGFLALAIDIEDFLKIEGMAVALICRSRDAKEFLCPQASQSAFEDVQPGVVRRWQRNSQHAPIKCMRSAKRK